MRLQVVGSSPAWPNPGGAQSGYLVDERLLLDCGPGVLAKLRTDAWPSVAAIVITHWHLDHWGDVVSWVWGHMFGLGRDLPLPELWLPPGGTAELREFERIGRPGMFEQAFSVHEYEPRVEFETAGFRITPVPVQHYDVPTFAMRVEHGERVLAYSGDAAPGAELAELARDADLFLCEATLERGDLDGDPRGHLSAEEAIEAYRASGARRLLLTHRPAELPLPDGVELAYDGLELEL